MNTTTLTYSTTLTYESDEPLDIGDMEALRKEIECSLINANGSGALDPHGYTIQCVTLEVTGPEALSITNHMPAAVKVPETDEAAFWHLFTGLGKKGWMVTAYDLADGGQVGVRELNQLLEAVQESDEPVRAWMWNPAYSRSFMVVVYFQGSPEDVLVDHTQFTALSRDITALWGIFKPPAGVLIKTPHRKIPATDEDALRYLFTGLEQRGWNFRNYDDGGDFLEPFESIEGLVEAVVAVSDTVTVYLYNGNEKIDNACLVLLAQDSPEDVLVDHSYIERLNTDTNELWEIFDPQ